MVMKPVRRFKTFGIVESELDYLLFLYHYYFDSYLSLDRFIRSNLNNLSRDDLNYLCNDKMNNIIEIANSVCDKICELSGSFEMPEYIEQDRFRGWRLR